MLVVTTLSAALLGTFGAELMRARRQHEVIEKLYMTDAYNTGVATHYRLGWLGNGKLAALACDWVHSDFGCHVDAGTGLGHIAELPLLEILSLAYNSLTTDHLKLLSRSPSMRQLCVYRTSGPHATLPPRDEVGQFFEQQPHLVVEWDDAPRLTEWKLRPSRPTVPVPRPSGAFGTGSGGGSF